MKRNKNLVIGCGIVAAICFGIVSYGHFYRSRMELGLIFALLAIALLTRAWKNGRTAEKLSLPPRQGEEQDEE